MTAVRKIAFAMVWVGLGVPAAAVLALLAWCALMDRTNGTLSVVGLERRYLLFVPTSYSNAKPVPLVISLHPAATWPAAQRYISGWNAVAEKNGFIVVYPAGTGAFFGGLGPGPQVWAMGPKSLPRDVAFISALIDSLEARYSIDPRRIYVDGMSNGGAMAFALACTLSARIAAIGAVGAAHQLSWQQCTITRSVPVIAFHGTADRFAPYRGGPSPVAPGDFFPDIIEWTARIAGRNGCAPEAHDTHVAPSVSRRNYDSCGADADVVLYTIEGGGHSWPGGGALPEWIAGSTTREISATRIEWAFFTAHPMPLP